MFPTFTRVSTCVYPSPPPVCIPHPHLYPHLLTSHLCVSLTSLMSIIFPSTVCLVTHFILYSEISETLRNFHILFFPRIWVVKLLAATGPRGNQNLIIVTNSGHNSINTRTISILVRMFPTSTYVYPHYPPPPPVCIPPSPALKKQMQQNLNFKLAHRISPKSKSNLANPE